MIAAVYQQFQQEIQLQQVPDPELSPHGVILQVNATGLCRSDWHGWMGHDADITLPHVPGHEMSGVIVEIGAEVKNWRLGQRVTLPFVCGCGQCLYCRQGDPQVCDFQFQPGFTHWGSFAELVHIHYAQQNLVALPDSIADRDAAALGCRFATSFRALVDQGRVNHSHWVAIFGCGGVGLSAIMIAKAFDASVVAVDVNEAALEQAQDLGADLTLNAKNQANLPAVIKEHTSGGAHLTLDALGHRNVVSTCLKSLRKRGRHIQVGLLDPQVQNVPIPMNLMVAGELEIYGSHGMQASRYQQLISMIEQGQLQPGKLITREINLGEAPQALMEMDRFDHAGVTVVTNFSL